MAAAERRVHQVADPRVARPTGSRLQYSATSQRADVADVELRVDAVDHQVDGQADHVDVARALAVPEQRALHAIGAGQHRHLGSSRGGAASLCGCRPMTTLERLRMWRPNHSITSAYTLGV